MTDIENAIEEMQSCLEITIGHGEVQQANCYELAISALKEKAERGKGCEYCKVPGKYLATIDYDGAETRLFFDVVGNSLRVFDEEMPGLCDSFSIKSCPCYNRGEPDPRYEMIRCTNFDLPMKDFGKTVFLTRADAEKAAKEREPIA